MRYRRDHTPGATYFFTVVTERRRPIFSNAAAIQHLRAAFRAELAVRPFEIFAITVLPDHIHAIWTLPEGDSDYSTRWRRIKARFTAGLGWTPAKVSPSRERKGERAVWQRRFWEHRIRDEGELAAYADYIHWNPVKHGLVTEPEAWPYSSFARFVRDGVYGVGWGGGKAETIAAKVVEMKT